jgi:UDP-N-acetylglucosamine 2-epimerase (non-hydrolysing)
VVIGTRPEAIKIAPVVWALKARPHVFETLVCATGQHRKLLDGVLTDLQLQADADLRVMARAQTPAQVAGRILERFSQWLRESRPDLVLVQGDTTSAAAAGLAAAYESVAVVHVEAGLRTDDPRVPFPEELNRRMLASLASLHFAPTPLARDNLLREGIASDRILVSGNTGLDTLRWAVNDAPAPGPGRREVIVTAHRRESIATGLGGIARSVLGLAARFPDVAFVWPQHPNPRVRLALSELRLRPLPNLELPEPLPYREFVRRLARATLVLTDSGGLQEEAAALGVPLLVVGDKTARQEGLEVGVARTVGTHPARVLAEAARLLEDPAAHAEMAVPSDAYGDGYGAQRIVAALAESEDAEAHAANG